MKENTDIGIEYIDLDILESSFSSMTITLGSGMNDKEIGNVVSMIKGLNPAATLKYSKHRRPE